jgi:hypothetical protein
MVESLLLAVTRITTCLGSLELTGATGFFFERDSRLFLITAGHVVRDEANRHLPDRLLIELHIDPDDVARTTRFSIPLYIDGVPHWRETGDAGGNIDVVAIEIERAALPDTLLIRAFTTSNLLQHLDVLEDGHLDLNCAWYADALLPLTT